MKLKLLDRSRIITLMIIIIVCSYVGVFASYKGNLLLIGISLIVWFVLGKRIIFHNNKENLGWVVLILYLVLNSALNFPKSLLYLLLIIAGGIIGLYRFKINDIDFFLNIYKFITVLLAVSVVVQYVVPDFFYKYVGVIFSYSNQYQQVYSRGVWGHQYSGFFYEVSFTALVLSTGMGMFVKEVLVERKNVIINVLISFIIYFAIFLTGKRSMMLIVPAVIIIMFFVHNIKHLTVKNIIAVIAVLVLLIILHKRIFSVINNVLSRGSNNGLQLMGREAYWKIALDMFKSNPLVGKGLNSFDVRFNQSRIKNIAFDFAGAHNSYLQWLAETGIIGMILLINVLLMVLKKIKRFCQYSLKNQGRAFSFIFMIMVLLIYGLVGNIFYQPQQMILLIWLINGLKIISENEHESNKTVDFKNKKIK